MAGLPKKYAKMGFKKGWAAYKKSKRATTTKRKSTKRKTAPKTRRRSTVARKKQNKRRGKKTFRISILGDVAPLGWGYMTISGNQIGEVLDQAIGAVMEGNGDLAEILMTEIQQTIANVTTNPVQVGLRLAIGIGAFKWISKVAGRRKIFQIGKFVLTT